MANPYRMEKAPNNAAPQPQVAALTADKTLKVFVWSAAAAILAALALIAALAG